MMICNETGVVVLPIPIKVPAQAKLVVKTVHDTLP